MYTDTNIHKNQHITDDDVVFVFDDGLNLAKKKHISMRVLHTFMR